MHWNEGDYAPGPCPISPQDPHAPEGLFETLLHDGFALLHADAHLQRLERSLKHFGRVADRWSAIAASGGLERIAARLAQANALQGLPARVNVFAVFTRERGARLCVAARPHDPQPGRQYALMPWVREPDPHAAHKTLRRPALNRALARARDNGFDDALLHTPGGRLLETSYAALLFRLDGAWRTPSGPLLPSTALAAARTVLDLRPATLRLDDLPRLEHAFVLNSLRGMRPVTRIAGQALEPDEASCQRFRTVLTGRAEE